MPSPALDLPSADASFGGRCRHCGSSWHRPYAGSALVTKADSAVTANVGRPGLLRRRSDAEQPRRRPPVSSHRFLDEPLVLDDPVSLILPSAQRTAGARAAAELHRRRRCGASPRIALRSLTLCARIPSRAAHRSGARLRFAIHSHRAELHAELRTTHPCSHP